MKYLKQKFLQLNTDKSEGKVEWVLGMFLLTFMLIFMLAELQIMDYKTTSDCIEDAIAASGLASALIDVERFAQEREVVISEPLAAYSEYKNSLMTNLGKYSETALIEKYIIYNVEEDLIEIVTVSERGIESVDKKRKGTVYAPNGELIKSTGVYNEISFDVEGIFGMVMKAQKGKLVEINLNDMGEKDEVY